MSKEGVGEEAVSTSSANRYYEEQRSNNSVITATTSTNNVVSETVTEKVNFTNANVPILKKKSRSTSCLLLKTNQKHSSRDKTGLKDGRHRHFSCQNGENHSSSFSSSSKFSSSTTTTATSTTTISSFSSTSSLENEISRFNDDQNEEQLSSPKKRNKQSQSSLSQIETIPNDDEQDNEQSQKQWIAETSGITLLDFPWDDIHFVYTLPLLGWKDLFNLRRTSVRARELVEAYFSKLKILDASQVRPPFSIVPFRVITENCTMLRKLIVADSDWIEDGDLTRIFRENKFLAHVDLSGCSKLNGSCLLSLSVNCKLLTTLILRDCTWVSRGAVETLMAHLRRLEVVDFTSCAQISNQQISPFTKAFPQLKRLHLARIQTVNDSTLTIIARNCKNILHLDIRACMGVTDNGIRMIAEYCTKLQSLCIDNCHLVTEYSLNILRVRGHVSIDRPCSFVLPMFIPRVQV